MHIDRWLPTRFRHMSLKWSRELTFCGAVRLRFKLRLERRLLWWSCVKFENELLCKYGLFLSTEAVQWLLYMNQSLKWNHNAAKGTSIHKLLSYSAWHFTSLFPRCARVQNTHALSDQEQRRDTFAGLSFIPQPHAHLIPTPVIPFHKKLIHLPCAAWWMMVFKAQQCLTTRT